MGYYDDKEVNVYKNIALETSTYKLGLIKKLEKDLSLDISEETRSILEHKINEIKNSHEKAYKEYLGWDKLSKDGVQYVDWDHEIT